jgi:hypothetical protein
MQEFLMKCYIGLLSTLGISNPFIFGNTERLQNREPLIPIGKTDQGAKDIKTLITVH